MKMKFLNIIGNSAVTAPTLGDLDKDLEFVMANIVDAPIGDVLDQVVRARSDEAARNSWAVVTEPCSIRTNTASGMPDPKIPTVLGSSEFTQDRSTIDHMIAVQEEGIRREAVVARRAGR